MSRTKLRLDNLLVQRGLVETRSKGAALIMAGEIRVEDALVIKAGTLVKADAKIEVSTPMPYVSRGGYKLDSALETFDLEVSGRICADVGACTGGFTDVLLQRKATRVYAIDVGYGQLAWKLRQDDRVIVMERTNARYLNSLPEPVNFVCIDVSFISLRLILPAVRQWLSETADVVALIKPQFEAERVQVGKGGIVRSEEIHRQVLKKVRSYGSKAGLTTSGLIRSPILKAQGNREFLQWLTTQAVDGFDYESALNISVQQ